jgi:heat shock protein HslJ
MPRLVMVASGLMLATLLVACGGGGGQPAARVPSLDGSSWTLTDLGNTPAHPGGTLAFDGGGISGSTGCNTFHGTYRQSGDSLSIELGPTTLIGCPPPLEAQERAVHSGLAATSTFTESAGTLTLHDRSGKALLAYTSMSYSALVGPKWDVTAVNNGKHAVVSVLAGTTLTVQFGKDGQVSGSAGCNTYSAKYSLDGDVLHVDPPAATRKLCHSPAGVMEQETEFLHALERSTVVEGTGHVIALRGADNAIQMTL